MTNGSLVKPDAVYSVSQLTEIIKVALETAFPLVWVEGEISNFHRHSSGHLYFTLKDPKSQVRAVMFRFEAKKVAFDLKDGQKVVCRGRINVYEPRGEYQIVIDLVEPKGVGALQLAFEQLKEKLRLEGLFDPGRKKKLPLRPRTIGVVTSPRGAAIVDILRTLERRYARLHVLIYPAKVQGEGASAEIVEGIDYLSNLPGIDVLIVGRGGGSIEDLWAFNEEKVARAIHRSPVPVISAVGHEVDFTIADFVADIRASTPSAAAEMVIEKEQAFAERIAGFEQRAERALKYFLQRKENEVVALARHRAFQSFKVRILNLAQGVDDLETRAWKVLRSGNRASPRRRPASFSLPNGSGPDRGEAQGAGIPLGQPVHGIARPQPAEYIEKGIRSLLESRRAPSRARGRRSRRGGGCRRLLLQGRAGLPGPGGRQGPEAGVPAGKGDLMTNLSFEKALADLEQIVAKLEKGGIALNESLILFEKGVKLARFLRGELEKAEKKVEILLKDEKGEIRAEDFEPESVGSAAKSGCQRAAGEEGGGRRRRR